MGGGGRFGGWGGEGRGARLGRGGKGGAGPSCCIVWALRAHYVHTVHAEAGILTQEYLSPDWLHSEAAKPT